LRPVRILVLRYIVIIIKINPTFFVGGVTMTLTDKVR